jgi:hypothetical protein
MRRVLMLALVAIGGLGATAGFAQSNDKGVTTSGTGFSGLANVIIGSGSLSSNSAPTSALRVFRDAAPSVCNTKSFPGTVGGGPFAYTVVPYTNTGSSRCVTFTLSASCTNGNLAGVFLVGYSGAVNAGDLAQNYIGDSGSSTGTGFAPVQMSLNLAAGQTINLMVEQVNNTATSPPSTCSFTLSDDRQVLVPTMSPAAMAAMAGILALLGFAFLRRRGGSR